MDTAGHGGQGANYGGENAETTRTKQKVLQKNMHSKVSSFSISAVSLCNLLCAKWVSSVNEKRSTYLQLFSD